MSPIWPALVLLIITNPLITAGDWQSDESCVRQKYAEDKTEDHFRNLLKINTGYCHTELTDSCAEQKTSPTWTAGTAIDDVYSELLCSYVYNCGHYMNLIRPLLTEAGKDALTKLITADEPDSVFLFEDKVVDMLNVLYNFGMIHSADHLWLVYMYSRSLNRLDKTGVVNVEDKRVCLLQDHETVSGRLAQFTRVKCHSKDTDNVYDDQNDNSDFKKSLDAIRAYPKVSHEAIEHSVREFKTTLDRRSAEISQCTSIDDDCKRYFAFDSLCLRASTSWMLGVRRLLEDFAEITDDSDRYRAYRLIIDTCSKNFHVESYRTLTDDVRKCHDNFRNLVKYILLHTARKYVVEIAMYLPSSKPKSKPQINKVKKYKKWLTAGFAINAINKYNVQMYRHFSGVVRFLCMDGEDVELKFLHQLFQSPSYARRMAHAEENKLVEKEILKILKNVNANYFQFGESYFSTVQFPKGYFTKRLKLLQSIRRPGRVDSLCSNRVSESQLSFSALGSYLQETFSRIDFEVISSFDRFSEITTASDCQPQFP